VTTKAPHPPRLRFAPSPPGRLHLGHAFSALTTWAWAAALGGIALLRIEDIDPDRSRDTFVTGIYDDLRWLGLDWPEPVMVQSQRMAAYADARARLAEQDLLYPCYASRKEIAAATGDSTAMRDPFGAPLYPGRGHVLPARIERERAQTGATPVWRLDTVRALDVLHAQRDAPLSYPQRSRPDETGPPRLVPCDPLRWGDVVVIRKDVATSYHLSVVVDDAAQGITHVTRGQDLEATTDVHVLLQRLLGLPTPIYHHHNLITDDTGRKLAKSDGDMSLESLRFAGVSPDAVRRALGFASINQTSR